MKVQNGRKGFTLIELLVVIAIIAILAAILFPVFAQARAKARQTTCLSNLKQIDLSFLMYKQDYDETLPYWSWWYSSDQGGCPRGDRPGACKQFGSLWLNALYPYEKNAQLYNCPTDRNEYSVVNSNLYWWTQSNDPTTLVNVYGFERAVINQFLSYGSNEPLLNGSYGSPKDSLVDRPASTYLIADSITALSGGYGRPSRSNPADPTHNYLLRRIAYANGCDGTWYADGPVALPAWDDVDCVRHSGGANIGFADGHAKWMRASRITWDLGMGDQGN